MPILISNFFFTSCSLLDRYQWPSNSFIHLENSIRVGSNKRYLNYNAGGGLISEADSLIK